MQIWQILCLWMHPWRSEAGGHPNSPFPAKLIFLSTVVVHIKAPQPWAFP